MLNLNSIWKLKGSKECLSLELSVVPVGGDNSEEYVTVCNLPVNIQRLPTPYNICRGALNFYVSAQNTISSILNNDNQGGPNFLQQDGKVSTHFLVK